MAEFNLSALREDAILEVQKLVSTFDAKAERAGLIDAVETICSRFTLLAATSLLVDGKPQLYFLNLCRSGENWRRLTHHLRGRSEPAPPASKNTSLLGVLAAGNWELAEKIASIAARHWQPDDLEYEHEFRYAELLQRLISAGPDGEGSEFEDSVEQFAEVAADVPQTPSRVAMIQAVHSRDTAAFNEGFRQALALREETVEKRARALGPVAAFAPHRFLWFEGMALIRIAQRRGLDARPGHLYCPDLAWSPATAPYEGDWCVPLGE